MGTKVLAEYLGAQKDVLSVLETAWDNYLQNILKLAEYKPMKYTPALAVAAKVRIADARALPDFQARSGLAEELRIILVRKGGLCLNDFQLLKGYIDEAWKGEDEALRKPNYEEAGQNYYRDASREDWESVQSIGDSMKLYINNKLTVLTGAGMMPVNFQAEVETRRLEFEGVYADFKTAEQTQVATQNRIKAINTCYKEGMEMMLDAQRVYANDAAVRSLFVFSTLLDMINPKTAGVLGLIQDDETHEPLDDVTITFMPENEPGIVVKTNAEGEYASLQMRAQVYKVLVERVGYESIEDEVDVVTGTVTIRRYRMKLATPNP